MVEQKVSKEGRFNKCQNMLLGIAIGDALGVGFELLMDRKKVRNKFKFDCYLPGGPGWKNGQYSDDTQMSLAITELLISKKRFNLNNLADYFLKIYQRDPRRGYGGSVREGLRKSKNSKEFLRIIPGNSFGNGACMRAVPLGVLPKIKDVVEYAKINAKITHNVPSAIVSSVCVAVASHYFYYNLGKPEEVFDYCINICEKIDKESVGYFKNIKDMKKFNPVLLFGSENEFKGVAPNGMRTAGAVLYIISKFYKNPSETLRKTILLGGDTDTVASICFGIVAIKTGIEKLPDFLFRDLENNAYGRDYLIELGEKLEKTARAFSPSNSRPPASR
jgi:ADP-ribosyl-[dinitrogen reductase] hydrolase